MLAIPSTHCAILFVAFAVLVMQVSAGVQVVYPVFKQRPPIGRVGQSFTFTLLQGTFKSTENATISISAANLPSWATFASDSITFSGIPGTTSQGSTTVTVTGTEVSSNTSVSSSWDLIVSKRAAPVLNLAIGEQLKKGAVLSSVSLAANVSSISVPPAYSWSLGLLQNTITTSTSSKIYYSASQQGSIDLPSWIKFDPKTVTFDGYSPASPGTVVIELFGSDQYGYGDVKQSITVTVSQHVLDLSTPLPVLHVTAGQSVSYTVPTSTITIDGVAGNSSDVFDVQVDLAQVPFLQFDSATRTITGSIPITSFVPAELAIPVRLLQSTSNSELYTTIQMLSSSEIFISNPLPVAYVSVGQNFTLDLAQYITPSAHNATLSLGNVSPADASSWIGFSTDPLNIYGSPPNSSLFYANVSVVINAARGGEPLGSVSLPLVISATQSSGTAPPAGSGGPSLHEHSKPALSDKDKMTIASVFGAIGGLGLLIALLVCCRRNCEGSASGDYLDYREPIDKSRLRGAVSPISLGSTLVGTATPTFKATSPLMAVTPTEATFLEVTKQAVEMYGIDDSAPKQYGLFSIFQPEAPKSPTVEAPHSVHGLGILAPGHPDTQSSASSWNSQTVDEAVYPDLGATGCETPQQSSSDERSSWNSMTSSSVFYSDTFGEESDSPSPYATGGRRVPGGRGQSSSSPRSVPRQRRDFISPKIPHAASSSVSSADSRPGVGGIRLIGDPSRLSARSDDDNMTVESLGAIATAAFHRLSPQVSDDGWDSSTPTPKPQLIPFVGRRSPQTAPHPDTFKSSSAINSIVTDGPVEADITQIRYDGEYCRDSVDGGVSPVQFSTPSVNTWRYPNTLSPVSTDGHDSRFRGVKMLSTTTPALSPRIEISSSDPPAFSNQGLSKRPKPQRLLVRVGEPLYFNPSVKTLQGNDLSADMTACRTQYVVITDYPNQPEADRQPLPDWLKFDSKDVQLWGVPTIQDVGVLNVQLLERRIVTMPGTPSQGGDVNLALPMMGYQADVETILSRFVLEVSDKFAMVQ